MIKKLLFSLLSIFYISLSAQEDCISAITVCGNSNINYTPAGVGNIYESLGGCLSSGEHHSVWYKFTIATSGTLTFNLTPTGPVDYDWAIYGPNTTCSNLGFPIRCNASGNLTSTGMNMTNTNTTSAGGPTTPYCKYMDVLAGQTYYLYIDNWSTTVYTFNLTWGGTATFVSPFSSSSIAPNPFIAPGVPGPNPNSPREISICDPTAPFNFSTLSSGIVNGNTNFTVTYFDDPNNAATGTSPITGPIVVTPGSTYYYNINYNDPNNPSSSLNSCKQTGSFIFTVNSLTASITASSTTLCPSGSVTLTSNNATGNTWSTGATTPSITVTAPGTYTLVSANGNCTSPQASITITADTDPNVQITGNLLLCDTPTQLTATSTGVGNIYTWSTGATGNSISVSTPGTYTVTVKTPANCTYQKSVTVTQGVVPAVQNTSLSLCSDTSTATFNLTSAQSNISTTPGVTFDYYLNLADAIAGNTSTIANPAAHVSGSTTIYVRVKSTTCSKVANLQLIVNQKPVPAITTSANVICNNGSVTLTSNFATGNTWSTGQTTQSITVNSAGTYTLTNNNGSCTSDPVSVIITNSPNPNVQISGNLTFCGGSSTTLTATATGTGNTFSWSNGVTGATNTVTTPGTYTVTVTTPLGCQYQSSAIVTMDPAITVNIATPAEITCTNTQVTLNASASVYQPGSTFSWTASGGGNIVSGANTLTPVVNNGGTYTLIITSALGCTKQGSVTVVKNITPPTITLNASSINICKGDSVVLTASGAATYTWTGLPGTGNTQTVSPTSTTTYTVTGIGVNGCPAQTNASITINVVPEITASLPNVEICPGDKATLNAGAGPNYSYSWSTGATTQTITTSVPGTYTVTINNGSCSKILTAVVSYIKTPEITSITYQNNTLTINVKNPANEPLEYSIDGGVTWQSSHIFTNVLKNTQYSIRVRKRGILCDTHTEYYTFLMTNTITPNSDGINDVIDFSVISKFGNFKGNIFDKYGKVVFQVSSKNPIWDGKYIGRPLPTDTYWYSLSWMDDISKKPIELSGWILLKNRE